jgi:uncharacterized surface protein with fasciclin (FAS1) repeats
LSLAISACGPTEPKDQTPAKTNTVVDVAAGDARFTKLVAAVKRAGLVETLSGAGPFTVFAPTDDAFTALGIDLDALPVETLKTILTYHVASGRIDAAAVSAATSQKSLQGDSLSIGKRGDKLFIDGVTQPIVTDIAADNGIVHALDSVLLPKGVRETLTVTQIVSAYPVLSTLKGAVVGSDLAGDTVLGKPDGTFTVFAPDNAAFERFKTLSTVTGAPAVLKNVLLYHVLGIKADKATALSVAGAAAPGNEVATALSASDKITLRVDGSTLTLNETTAVVYTDITAKNGVIHLVDSVLVPKTIDFPGTIADFAQSYPNYSTLVDLLSKAGLVPTFTNSGTFTLFAPTNAAFAKLPASAVSALTADPTGALADKLKAHVLSSEVDSVAVVAADGTSVTTLNPAASVTIAVANGVVTLNGTSKVLRVDVKTSNGIIHIIDTVL